MQPPHNSRQVMVVVSMKVGPKMKVTAMVPPPYYHRSPSAMMIKASKQQSDAPTSNTTRVIIQC